MPQPLHRQAPRDAMTNDMDIDENDPSSTPMQLPDTLLQSEKTECQRECDERPQNLNGNIVPRIQWEKD